MLMTEEQFRDKTAYEAAEARGEKLRAHLKSLDEANSRARIDQPSDVKQATTEPPINAFDAGVKPGSPEAKTLEQQYKAEWANAPKYVGPATKMVARPGDPAPGSLKALEMEYKQRYI
jgi:hypothetical protein